MKKFKTKKSNQFFKFILLFLIIYFSYFLINSYINSIKSYDPKSYIKSLLNNNLNNQLISKDNKSNSINPVSLFEYNLSLNNKVKQNEIQTMEYVEKLNDNMKDPIIYIYNTHESEEYKIDYKYEYSIIPNVKLASYILQEKLENLGINSIVETSSVKDILNQNNWIYKYSYKASRVLLEKAYQDNKSLKYFIDIHRDSSGLEKTYLEYNGKEYARVLFVVGLEHENYEYNLELTNRINDLVEKIVPGISRGISKKEGLGVNGIYNQDFSRNCILIEIGGVENNIMQVSSTVNVLGDALKLLINK